MTVPIKPTLLALYVILMGASLSPSAYAGNAGRDALLDLVASLTDGASGWSCEGGQTCQKLSDAQVTFVRRGDDVFVQSHIDAWMRPDPRGNWIRQQVVLERAVILDVALALAAFHFQAEYAANEKAYSILLACAKGATPRARPVFLIPLTACSWRVVDSSQRPGPYFRCIWTSCCTTARCYRRTIRSRPRRLAHRRCKVMLRAGEQGVWGKCAR